MKQITQFKTVETTSEPLSFRPASGNMRICPIDWQESGFRAAHWTTNSARRALIKDKTAITPELAASTQHYTFCADCRHAEAFARALGLGILTADRKAEIEAKWDAEAERLFVYYTREWKPEQRDAHRARLWPKITTFEDWHNLAQRHTKTPPQPQMDNEMPATAQPIASAMKRLPYADT